MTTKVNGEPMGNAGRSQVFVPRIMRTAAAGTGVPAHGGGDQLRDLVHVDDIVAGIFTTHDLKSGPATEWLEFAGAETAQ